MTPFDSIFLREWKCLPSAHRACQQSGMLLTAEDGAEAFGRQKMAAELCSGQIPRLCALEIAPEPGHHKDMTQDRKKKNSR